MSRDKASPNWWTGRLRGTAVRLNQNRSVNVLARIGLAVKGLVYLTIGGIALNIAVGSGGRAGGRVSSARSAPSPPPEAESPCSGSPPRAWPD